MKAVNVAVLKSRLSEYLRYAQAGEEVLIKDRNRPVARLTPLSNHSHDEHSRIMAMAAEGLIQLPEKARKDAGYKPPRGRLIRCDLEQLMGEERDER